MSDRITHLPPPMIRRARRGYTLVELLVALGVFSLVMMGVVSLLLTVTRYVQSSAEGIHQNARARTVDERFLFDLRAITTVESSEARDLTAVLNDYASGTSRRVRFSYDRNRHALVRTDLESGQTQTVLTHLQDVHFTYFSRKGPARIASQPAEVNAIQVELTPENRSALLLGRNHPRLTATVQLRNRSL